jgi:hypothetical protein
MLDFRIAIESDEKGGHVVVFRPQGDELSCPATYGQRVTWIRRSYERFDEKVRQKRAIIERMEIN